MQMLPPHPPKVRGLPSAKVTIHPPHPPPRIPLNPTSQRKMPAKMTPYVPPTSQLVLELFVRDLPTSIVFYTGLGFTLVDQRDQFVELAWEDHLLYLDGSHPSRNLPPLSYHPQANVRIMVPDVDGAWQRAKDMGARVLVEIEDRYYGLRDFTVLDPDGFGVRFGTRIPVREGE